MFQIFILDVARQQDRCVAKSCENPSKSFEDRECWWPSSKTDRTRGKNYGHYGLRLRGRSGMP